LAAYKRLQSLQIHSSHYNSSKTPLLFLSPPKRIKTARTSNKFWKNRRTLKDEDESSSSSSIKSSRILVSDSCHLHKITSSNKFKNTNHHHRIHRSHIHIKTIRESSINNNNSQIPISVSAATKSSTRIPTNRSKNDGTTSNRRNRGKKESEPSQNGNS
jgi:hypothetical protein